MTLGIDVLFSSGRRVYLDQLHIIPTRSGLFANDSLPLEKRIAEVIAKYFGTSEIPFLIKNQRRHFLPRTCLALFSSEPMVKYGVTIEHSLLIVCWFTQDVDVPIRQLVCEALSDIEWEQTARDFHSDW